MATGHDDVMISGAVELKASLANAARGGRPPIPFDDGDRETVRLLARTGTPRAVIAKLVGCCERTLRNRFPAELAEANEIMNALVAAALLEAALGGDLRAIIWWEKTRRGMSDPDGREHGGRAGIAIEVDRLRPGDRALVDRAAAILEGRNASGGVVH